MRRFIHHLSLATITLLSSAASAGSLYRDPNDGYSLLQPHLFNRQLNLQLDSQTQPGLFNLQKPPFAFASEVAIGTQQTLDGSAQSRFHGYYVADTFGWVELTHGLEGNLNLSLYNPSASDGFRVSSQISAGLAIHASTSALKVDGDPLHLTLVGPDLDRITLGHGLLLEQLPCEGLLAGAEWRHWTVDTVYIGRALWPDDDLISVGLGGWQKAIELRFTAWTSRMFERGITSEGVSVDEFSSTPKDTAAFLSANAEVPLGTDAFRLATEYALRIRQPGRSAFMVRLDYLDRTWELLELHVGYQLRWYQAGVGPRRTMLPPSRTHNLPAAEDTYVTNSFEIYGISEDFEQIWHTLMVELQSKRFHGFEAFAELELTSQIAFARTSPKRVVYTAEGFRAPGTAVHQYHRAGLRWYPWPQGPHRFSILQTNKQVNSGLSASEPVANRFSFGNYVVAELEVWL